MKWTRTPPAPFRRVTVSKKNLAHQLAVAHKEIVEVMGGAESCQPNADAQVKRINAAARCMAVYQQGMLALHKIRQNGHQRIMVQYVNVSQGSPAVVGNIEPHRRSGS